MGGPRITFRFTGLHLVRGGRLLRGNELEATHGDGHVKTVPVRYLRSSDYKCGVRPIQARTPAITVASQLAHTGIDVAPTVTGHLANARKSCRIATMAKIAPARRE